MVEQDLSKNPNELDGVNFRQIASIVANSEYGKILREQTRFTPYKPEGMSAREWQGLIGLDGNNLLHMPMTARIAQFFTHYCNNPPKDWPGPMTEAATFSKREEALLVLTAHIHDVGEAIVGDIPAPIKTEEDHQKEMVVLESQMRELFGAKGLYKAVGEALDSVEIPRDTKLAKAFKAIEHLGYLRVGIRAWERKDKVEDPEIKKCLEKMIEGIRSREFPRQYNYAQIYPATFEFLNRPKNKQIISEIIAAN